jgi:hypothetical protein
LWEINLSKDKVTKAINQANQNDQTTTLHAQVVQQVVSSVFESKYRCLIESFHPIKEKYSSLRDKLRALKQA